MNYGDIGKRIRAARVERGLSQAQLAEATGYTVEHISHTETASTKVSLPALVKIANALDVSVDMLLCDVVYQSGEVFKDQLGQILQDCDSAELGVITDTIAALKESLRNRNMKRSI